MALTSETIQKMKELLADECLYHLSDNIMTDFLNQMDIRYYRNKQVLIEEGDIESDIYIVKEGILAEVYLDGVNERCWAFGLPGSMLISSPGYYMNKPTFFRVVACGDTEVLHLSKQCFDHFIEKSHEFAKWALSMARCQIYFFEYKNIVINGSAAERFTSLAKNRPEIIKNVPNKLIASYLGITQQYLSKLKRKLLKEGII
ncbi:MAG: Crp/Fnr family transcriptional regulator [Muribaculaceae bacterium]